MMAVKARKRIYDMNDREFAAYKKQKAAKLKLKKFIARIALAVVSIIALSLVIKAFSSKAESTDDVSKCKFYKTVSLEYGESLLDVAEKNYDSEYYDSVKDYLSEIMQINHVKSGDELSGGKNLYVPYYSEIH